MAPSLVTRQRSALLVFFVADHLLWYFGGHVEQVSLLYVVVSEFVRLGALAVCLLSYFRIDYIDKFMYCLVWYCYLLLPLNAYGAFSEHVRDHTPAVNVLWFKKEAAIPVEHGMFAAGLYLAALVVLYVFVFKPAGHPLLKQKEPNCL